MKDASNWFSGNVCCKEIWCMRSKAAGVPKFSKSNYSTIKSLLHDGDWPFSAFSRHNLLDSLWSWDETHTKDGFVQIMARSCTLSSHWIEAKPFGITFFCTMGKRVEAFCSKLDGLDLVEKTLMITPKVQLFTAFTTDTLYVHSLVYKRLNSDVTCLNTKTKKKTKKTAVAIGCCRDINPLLILCVAIHLRRNSTSLPP